MTREEAINMLYGMRADNLNLDDVYTKDKYEAISMAIEILENQKSFIEELEKIKTELENPKVISMDFFEGLAYAEEIIDKHISELKGENK